MSGVSTQELEEFVRKHWFGGIPTYGQGESVKRAMRELRRRQKQGVAEGEKKPYPKTWHDVDPKLGKQVDKMSQAEKVKKGLAHPDTLKKQGVAEGSSMNASQALRDFNTIAKMRDQFTYAGLEQAGHADKVLNAIKACSAIYNYFKNNKDFNSAKAIDNLRSELIAFKNGDISTLSQLINRGTLDKINLQEQGVAEGQCNMSEAGAYCPEHGLAECGMYEYTGNPTNFGLEEGDELARLKKLALNK